MSTPVGYTHGLRRMTGRGHGEAHRVASPLELLFDLVFAAAFGVAGSLFAHGIAAGHSVEALGAFIFAVVAIVWAWINYSWFASAFDTDDWFFRVLTMVQMSGVIVLAIGLPQMFASLEHGGTFHNEVMVCGYIVMRVALVAQWLRAAAQAPQFRRVAMTYAAFIITAQVGWVVVAFAAFPIWIALSLAAVLWILELSGPAVAERKGEKKGSGGTPWHAHHIAERYSLLAIISLGETVLGTLAAARAIEEAQGWSLDAIVVIAVGIALTFALWWNYFLVPSGDVLAAHRERAFVWGYGHAFVFGAIAAAGAGLHVIGYVYDPEFDVTTLTAVTCLAVPVLVYAVALYGIYSWLIRGVVRNLRVQIPAIGFPLLAIALAAMGLPLWACLVVVVVGPTVTIISYESGAWRTLEQARARAVE